MKKKKRDIEFYKDHTITWGIDKLSDIRDVVDDVYRSVSLSAYEKENIIRDYAREVEDLVDLLDPFEHDHDNLIEWAKDFMAEYEDNEA